MRKKLIFLFLLLGLFFIPTIKSQATETDSNNLSIIKADEIINSSFYTISDNVIVEGKINGDLIALSKNIIVNGQIEGDIIALAEKIEVNGRVGGNIRALSSEINLNGPVARNITVLADRMSLGENSLITWDAYVASSYFENNGLINGELKHHDLNKKSTEKNNPWSFAWSFIYKFFCALIVGLVLIFIGKKILPDLFKTLEKNHRKTLLSGLLLLIIPPFIFFFLTITLIGIPLMLILFALYLLLIYLTKIFIALFVGKMITNKLLKKENENLIWPLILGLLIVYLLLAIPYFGAFLSFIFIILGLGTIYLYAKNKS